ncbi:MAG: FAD-dependent oxidoreductase [Pseudomonadota bacterium]
MTETLAIVGAGHAAGQLVASLVMGGYEGQIVLFGNESVAPYQRPPLSKKYLQGELPAERLLLKPESFYPDNGVELHLNEPVTAIDIESRSLQYGDGQTLRWDKLVFATGSRVTQLPVPGAESPGVHYLRSIADVDAIRAAFAPGKRLLIIGGGYIGLEVAAVGVAAELDVALVEIAPRLLSRVASPQLSEFYLDVHRNAGVDIQLSTGVERIEPHDNGLRVTLNDDRSIDTDLIVIGIGVSAETTLAASAGLKVDNGILVDEHCQTSAADVFAIGDCTNHPNPLLEKRLRLESVPNALAQGRCAAATILGAPKAYAEIPWFWSDQYDLKLQMVGLTDGYDDTVIRGDMAARKFACFYLRDGVLIGVDAVNSPKEFMLSKPAIAAGARIPTDVLADPDASLKDAATLWPGV